MNILAVDDEHMALSDLVRAIETAQKDANVTGFTSAKKALEYARANQADVAFLDIHMGEMSGLELAKRLKEIDSKINIIFATAHSAYTGDAFALHASGYVMKPIDPEDVRKELDNLRNPVKLPDRGLFVQCFGSFEVFADGSPLRFPRAKSKEVFAYLVHKNGASCTMRELAAVLEEESSGNVKKYVSDMIKTLKENGFGDAVIKTYNSAAVNPAVFDCDFYRYLKADAAAVNAFMGEYMAQYSWAEFVTGYLDRMV